MVNHSKHGILSDLNRPKECAFFINFIIIINNISNLVPKYSSFGLLIHESDQQIVNLTGLTNHQQPRAGRPRMPVFHPHQIILLLQTNSRNH